MYEIQEPEGIHLETYLSRHRHLKPEAEAEAPGPPSWYDPFEAYAQSKLANVLFAQEFASRFRAEGERVLVNAHAPGAVKTHLIDHIVGPGGELERAAGSLVRRLVMWHLGLLHVHGYLRTLWTLGSPNRRPCAVASDKRSAMVKTTALVIAA